MEDFYINSTSQEESYDYSNITYNYTYYDSYEYYEKIYFIMYVVTCIISGVGLPLTLVAIYALYSQVRNDHVAPIYVINLLITDLIQLCCFIVKVATTEDQLINYIFFNIYIYCVTASIGFMVCVALERYLVIACPLWYRFRRTIKISVVVCVLVWILPLSFVLMFNSSVDFNTYNTISSVLYLLPLPLFIFFLGGVLKALSASISVPSDEKRRIVGVLVLVLLIYILLFLPRIILYLADGVTSNSPLYRLSIMFVRFSPLADLTLYVFMRKGIIDKLLSSVCCCRMDSSDINSSSV